MAVIVARAKRVPKKLKNDAIVESLLEVRYKTTSIAEVLFGQIAEHRPWRSFEQRRLPFSQVPAAIREAEPNLSYQPIFELYGKQVAIRVGPAVISYHRTAPYIGWEQFQPELEDTIQVLFEKARGLVIKRLGLRYLNALRHDVHGISSISDLDLEIKVAGEPISGNANLNFSTELEGNTACMVRVATTDFVQGNLPQGTSVYVDVDVYTKEGFETNERKDVEEWLTMAHDREKEQFFRLLSDKSIETLEER